MAALAALIAFFGGPPLTGPPFEPIITITPRAPVVFAGASIALRVSVRGSSGGSVRWSLLGAGALRPNGSTAVYDAPNKADIYALIVAAVGGDASATEVRVVRSPNASRPLILITCFTGETVDVRDAGSLQRLGEVAISDEAGGIAIDPRRRLALVTARDHVTAIDLTTMHAVQSAPTAKALLSSVAELAGGIFAVADANARAGQPGIRFYRIDSGGTPVVVGGVAAGETPEAIAAGTGGRVFYVSNTNSNSIMRFDFDPQKRAMARQTGIVKTATRPFGIALDERRHRLFVADNDTPYISGARSKPGLEIFALPSLRRIGAAINTGTANALPLGVAVDDAAGRVFVTNEGDSTVAVFRESDMQRIGTLRTGLTPWLPAIDSARHRLLVPGSRADIITTYDTRRLAATRSVSTCGYPTELVVLEGGRATPAGGN